MSKSRATRCSASRSAPRATSRTCRSPEPRENSSLRPHQRDENVFERAFGRVQVVKLDSGAAKISEQGRDLAALALAVVGVGQFAAVRRQDQIIAGESGWHAVEPVVEQQRQLFLAELAHQLCLLLDQDDLTLVDHPD